MTAPTLVASTNTNAGHFASSLTMAKPSGTTSGDLMIAMVGFGGVGNLITEPAGWTHFAGSPDTSGGGNWEAAFVYKVAGGSEPADYTWARDFGAFFGMHGAIFTLRGYHGASPFDGLVIAHAPPTAFPIDITGPVTTNADCFLLGLFTFRGSQADMAAWSPGFTEEFEVIDTGTLQFSGNWKVLTSAGAVGTVTLPGGSSSQWITALIAVAPAEVITRSGADTVTAADAATPSVGYTRRFNDTATAADNGAALRGSDLTFADTATGADHAVHSFVKIISVADAATAADAAVRSSRFAIRTDDTVTTLDSTGGESLPHTALIHPLDGQRNVAPDTNIVLALLFADEWDVDLDTLTVTVNEVVVWQDGVAHHGWSAEVVPSTSEDRVTYTLYPSPGFSYGEKVHVVTEFSYGEGGGGGGGV